MRFLKTFFATTSFLVVTFSHAVPNEIIVDVEDLSPEMKVELQITRCKHASLTAKNIMNATIKSGKFFVRDEVLLHTAPDSSERRLMQALFASNSLLSSVLVRNASYGAEMSKNMGATPEGIENSKRAIEHLTEEYVYGICFAQTLGQPLRKKITP